MKIGIVTGASSGLGREFVIQLGFLYKNLDEIWVVARRLERMEQLKEKSRIPLRIFEGDLTRNKVYKKLEKELEKTKAQVRILVNCAGFGKSGTAEEIAGQDRKIQCDMIDLNCRSLTAMTLLTLPYFGKGGRILQLASAAAFCPQPEFAVYAATKSYVLSFSRALNTELKKRKISVTAVCPGPVRTDFFEISGMPQNWIKELAMATAPDVVHKALCDGRKRKALSIYGMTMKAAYWACKLIPHRIILCAEQLAAGKLVPLD